MCFGGGRQQQAPQPTPPSPGILNVAKAAPDPSQMHLYRGEDVGANTSGRAGGGLLLDAAAKAPKVTLGGS